MKYHESEYLIDALCIIFGVSESTIVNKIFKQNKFYSSCLKVKHDKISNNNIELLKDIVFYENFGDDGDLNKTKS